MLSSVVAPGAPKRQRSVVGEGVVWPAEICNGDPECIAHAVPVGVGEVSQIERAIVEDAVVAAGEIAQSQ